MTDPAFPVLRLVHIGGQRIREMGKAVDQGVAEREGQTNEDE